MTIQFDCIKLHFSAPLHLSRGKEQFDQSAQTLHSDTIAAALYSAATQLGAGESEILEMLDTVRLSSAFPFWKSEYYFPKPMVRLPFELTGIPSEKQGKPIKKIRFLGKSWLERLLAGENGKIEPPKHLKNPSILSENVPSVLFRTEVHQRVKIAQDPGEDPLPYYTERIYFGKDTGLFVLAQWKKTTQKNLFEQAFRLLGDLGVGTDRSTGNGFFVPEFTTLTLTVPENASFQCAMGLYLPSVDDLTTSDLDQSTWSIQKRGGYLAGASNTEHLSLRKRSVYMYEIGSVFPNKPLSGKRVNLQPVWPGLNHKVWREGRPIFLPIHLQQV
jgi:CRISPR-associated protein Csm4